MPPTHPNNHVTADEYRTAARVLLSENFIATVGQYSAESVWCNAEADRLESAALVERLAHIAWTASQDAAYDRSHDTDENPPILIEWQDRTDDDRAFTRAGIRAILADLESSGRLLTEGGQILEGLIDCQEGQILTAEQADDVRTMLWSPGVTALEAFRRLRALFPATEPAEVNGNIVAECNSSTDDAGASRAQDITRAWMRHLGYSEGEVDSLEHAKHEDYGCEREDGGWSCYGESGDSLHKDWDEYDAAAQLVMFVLDPAPAVPAEEETKAEDESGWHWVQSAGGYYSGPACTGGYGCRSMAHHEGCLRPSLTASSPVVPAPTETGPWQTWQEVPDRVAVIRDRDGDRWKRCDAGSGWKYFSRKTTEWADVGRPSSMFAPFVAVEEGDA